MNKMRMLGLLLSFCLIAGCAAGCKKSEATSSDNGQINSSDESQAFTSESGVDASAPENSDISSNQESQDGALVSKVGSIASGSTKSTTSHAAAVSQTGGNHVNTASEPSSANNSTVVSQGKFAKYIEYGKSLQNTYTRLKKDKKLKVVYMGGSVTNGYGASPISRCWKELSFSWLKTSFPDANITMVDPSTGESGTYLGTYLLQNNVIAQKPDLVFMEYAINDNYVMLSNPDFATGAMIERQCETIIREIKQALPQCDIVMLLTIDQGTAKDYSWYYPSAESHAKIAKAYHVPVVNIGRALADHIKETGAQWNEYVTDIVHPNNKGYLYYWNVLKDYLNTALFKMELKTELLPADKLPGLVSEYLVDGNRQSIFPSEALAASIDGWTYDPNTKLNAKVSEAGSFKANISGSMKPFTFTFTGTEIALYTNLKASVSIQFSYTVDGGAAKTGTFFPHNPTMIARDLPAGKHTITVKPVASDAQKAGISVMYVSGVFCRDASKQTKK